MEYRLLVGVAVSPTLVLLGLAIHLYIKSVRFVSANTVRSQKKKIHL